MKKLFLTTIFLLITANLIFAQDYWVYIRENTKITDKNDLNQIAGMSDEGDIVEVLPCTKQYEPTDEEKKTYKIIKVKDMEEVDRIQMRDSVTEDVIIPGTVAGEPDKIIKKVIKYRRCNIKVSDVSGKEEFTKDEIKSKIKDTIEDKPIELKSDKLINP
jgi:hypothetical protein